MIVGAILVVIILYFFVKEGGKSVGNDGRKLGHYDYLIVGSGLYGATFNYFAKRSGKTTYIVEKRDVVGGNLLWKIEGIFVHKYGPQVFNR